MKHQNTWEDVKILKISVVCNSSTGGGVGGGGGNFFSEISIFEKLCSHNSNASKNTQLVFENIIFC